MLGTRLVLVLALLATLACGPSHGAAYQRAFAEAERAESAGRFAESAASYDQAAARAELARDRDYARYLAGLMFARAGMRSEATARLQAVAETRPPSEYAGASAYKRADLEVREGDEENGFRDMEAMLRRFPNDGLAKVALHRLLRRMDEAGGDTRTLAWLDEAQPSLAASERAEEVAYEIALRRARLGEEQAARDALVAVAARWPYPKGALFDDALWRASDLDEKLGRYEEAILDLRRMLAVRETSTTMGSYERPRFSPAQLRLALLYRDRLHDRARARDELHTLYADFTTSTLRDRALWLIADLWREDKDDAAACRTLGTLVKDFPDSRYVPCATARCQGIERPSRSKAPATCPGYLSPDAPAR